MRIQLSALALALAVTSVACKSKSDSGESGVTAGTTSATGTTGAYVPGNITTGSIGLAIEGACAIGWSVTGTNTGGYSWDASLTVDSSLTTCDGASDADYPLAFTGGNAYLNNNDVGAVTYTGAGAATFETAGYVAGGGGGSYAYVGAITY